MKGFEVKPVAIALLLFASLCCTRECYAQDAGDFYPATTNVWGAEYPRVDSAGRAQIRLKAPDATKVKVNFWSGPKVDMEKQSDGRSEEHTSELQSHSDLVCRLLLEKKK